jgi:hypothetical protein
MTWLSSITPEPGKTMDEPRTSRRHDAALLLLFLLLSMAVYGPVLSVGEYTYDGRAQIQRLHEPFLGEPALADRSLAGAAAVLADPHRFGPATSHLSWRPLTALTTLIVDHRLFRETAALSVALNLLLHGLAAWLLFLCLRRMLAGRAPPPHAPPATDPPATGGALAGALLFLLHPLNSETVLCAGFRPDLAATVLMLGMTLLILRRTAAPAHPESARPSGIPHALVTAAAVAAVFACALLFKEIAAAALVLMPLLAVMMRKRNGGKTALPRIFLLAAALGAVFAAFIVIWLRFRAAGYPAAFLGGDGRTLGVSNAVTALWEVYLRKLACPWPLRINGIFDPVASPLDPRMLWAAGGIAALLAATLLLFRHNRTAIFGLVWAGACFLPYMQLVPIPEPVAERFAYAPMAGIAMAAGALVWQLWPLTEHWPALRRTAIFTGAALAMLCAGIACRRSFDWRTDIGLNIANWEEAGDTRPTALESLGALYLMKADRERAGGDPAAAQKSLAKAGEALSRLRLAQPANVAGWRLGALWAWAEGRPEQAREFIRQAVRLAPDDTAVRAAEKALNPAQPPDTAAGK